MIENSKIEFNQLYVGFEFPSKSYTLDTALVSIYLDAVKEDNELFRNEKLVPPMELTAYALASLSDSISLPPGTIHVTQELDFTGLVHTGDTITCSSKVSRKQDRGGLHIMNTDIWVTNQNKEKVLTGRVGFILPGPVSGSSQQ
jgi:hypothetical protein